MKINDSVRLEFVISEAVRNHKSMLGMGCLGCRRSRPSRREIDAKILKYAREIAKETKRLKRGKRK